MSSDDIFRPAGLLERYHMTRQYLRLDSCVVVAGQFIGSSDERLTTDAVYAALVHAIHAHAALSVRIMNEAGPAPAFCRMPAIDLERVVRFLDTDAGDMNMIAEGEFMNPIDPSKDLPLWRLTVTNDNVVVFAWHHTTGDGQNASCSRQDFRAVKAPAELKLTAPLEELTDLSISFMTFVHALWGLIIPPSLRLRSVWTGNKTLTTVPATRKTNARFISISAVSVSRLLSSARAHDTTLTAVLYILGVSALSKLISKQPGNERFKRISTFVAVSFRSLVKVPITAMCELVSAYHTEEPFLTGFSWEKAAAYSKRLHKAVPKTRETIGLIKLLNGDYEGFFKSKLGKKRGVSMELSNLGLFKTDAWRIGGAYFAQDDGVVGGTLKMNMVGSPNGEVNISVTWGDGTVDDAFAEAFVKDLGIAVEELSNKS
ncbi:alcohol acetyltransferase-domain-containing protein [Phellopilus nigrolimitatus]|nr:alcohol acetyltransferase-domain-containing protein [Phellopilus nigrolimitatus]